MEARPGKLVIAPNSQIVGSWCRGIIKKILNESQFQVFFVDYGDSADVSLNELRALPHQFVSKLPFQAIACSLKGVKPPSSTWSEVTKVFFDSLCLNSSTDCMRSLNAIPEFKQSETDEVTGGPHYIINLVNQEDSEPQDLAQEMILQNYALPLDNHEDVCSSISLIAQAKKEEAEAKEKKRKEQAALTEHQGALLIKLTEHQLDLEEFDVHPDWLNEYRPNPDEPLVANSQSTESQVATVSKPLAVASSEKTEGESEALIAHTQPFKTSDSSRFPSTQWWQNDENVFVSVRSLNILTTNNN